MGKYDEQTSSLYHALRRAGIAAAIDRDGDEHLVEVSLPGATTVERKLVFDPTDDGSWRLDLLTADGMNCLTENVVQSVGEDYAAPIVTGLLLANLPPAIIGERIYYEHQQSAIRLVENGTATARLVGHTFDDPIACTIVAMLNAAIRAGRATGGNSAFWIEPGQEGQVYAQHGPNMPKQVLAVDGLSREAISSLVFELNGAAQMGAYT